KKSRGTSRIVTDAITIQNPRNRGGSTGHVLAKRSVTFTEIRTFFLFWIGPLSLEGRSLAICLCPRLSAGNGVNNGKNRVIVKLLPYFAFPSQSAMPAPHDRCCVQEMG
ncbi:hypothetical protein, partial [Pseudomonas aeruginosa]|uniref:hypothetical protein n=1 Tax=Pseudomonas aeruginosa TaxID=287 RepID=UPI001AEC0BA6